MRFQINPLASLIILAAAGFAGCGSGGVGEVAALNAPIELSGMPPAFADSHGDSHAHGDTGPHGGHLIELGHNHKYHAELVENDGTQTVTIHILDTHMKPLAIEQPNVSLSLIGDGSSNSFELNAVASDAAGNSRFDTADNKLFQMLESNGDVTGKLRLTIESTPYVGMLDHHEHEHDHSTHKH